MRKIPTLFVRDPFTQLKYVKPEVHPDCQWVLDGEGVATRKYDGTCVMLDDSGRFWARREVKPGKRAPANFEPISTDEVTGKTVGWEPIEQSAFYRWFREALPTDDDILRCAPGTYELVGPKINGNPEGCERHQLIAHADAKVISLPPKLDYLTCERAVRDLATYGYEGIVWHHPDGRMAKLKRKDFPEWKRAGE